MPKCKVCKIKFEPRFFLQKACMNPACLAEWSRLERERKSDVKHKERKASLKPKSKWLSELQAVFNKYIRLRDHLDGCISCDKGSLWHGQWHASHYYSRGHSSSLRFNLWNVHKSCSVCNSHLSGNIGNH